MDIKGPTGSLPVDSEPVQVAPGTASRESRNASSSPSQSVLLKLSSNLFKLGQVLNVIVAKVEQNALLLMLQDKILDPDGNPLNIQLRAPRTQAAEVGQRLQVQVTDIKQNIPTLSVVASQRPALVLADLLNQAQARQQPLQQLLNNLVQVKSTDALLASLPKQVTENIDALWRALPEAGQLQRPDNVRQAIQRSGPFLESQLLNAAQNNTRLFPALDTKTTLLRLAAALRQQNSNYLSREAGAENLAKTTSASSQTNTQQPLNPLLTGRQTNSATSTTLTRPTTNPAMQNTAVTPRVDPGIPTPPTQQAQPLTNMTSNQILELLMQQTEGSLQRTLTHQLHMLNTDSARQQLVFELPIKHGDGVDVFDMRIHPDQEGSQQQDEEQARPWTIMMAFNLEGLGAIRAQISLVDDQISTHWWAEQQQTVELFQQHMTTLQERLSHVGLEVDKIECQCGVPKVAPINEGVKQKTPYSDVNLDEKV